MLSLNDLAAKLKEIDGRGYKAYKDIQGCYRSGDSLLYIDFIQGDPFAPPSRVRVRVPMSKAGLPAFLYQERRPFLIQVNNFTTFIVFFRSLA
jgi:predicted ABC-class ATPase